MQSRFLASCAVVAILSGSAGAAFAADAAAATDAAAPADTGVQEVVVTAQRRTESVQKVPMTIQALSSNTIQQLNLSTLNDLLKYTPNVTYGGSGPGQGSVFMRGLSAGQAGSQSSAGVRSRRQPGHGPGRRRDLLRPRGAGARDDHERAGPARRHERLW